MKAISAKELKHALDLLWLETGARRREVTPFSTDEQDTVLKALTLMAALEEVGERINLDDYAQWLGCCHEHECSAEQDNKPIRELLINLAAILGKESS